MQRRLGSDAALPGTIRAASVPEDAAVAAGAVGFRAKSGLVSVGFVEARDIGGASGILDSSDGGPGGASGNAHGKGSDDEDGGFQ